MESVNVCFSALGVEDTTPHDVELGYYCPGLVDHSKLSPFHVLTSTFLKNETKFVIIGGVEVVRDVGLLLFHPLTKLTILQESATTSSFANYSC
jgi:hypothetical protein